jgi:hypothetical protein
MCTKIDVCSTYMHLHIANSNMYLERISIYTNLKNYLKINYIFHEKIIYHQKQYIYYSELFKQKYCKNLQ